LSVLERFDQLMASLGSFGGRRSPSPGWFPRSRAARGRRRVAAAAQRSSCTTFTEFFFFFLPSFSPHFAERRPAGGDGSADQRMA